VAPVHLLVVPNRHVGSLAELKDPALGGSLLAACAQVAQAAGLSAGYRVVSNSGADGGQSVAHLHFHVLGGRPMSWPPG
jgi:histidine triad (HIT) family protein